MYHTETPVIRGEHKDAFRKRINDWGTPEDNELMELLSGLTVQGYSNLDAGLTGWKGAPRIRKSMETWAWDMMSQGSEGGTTLPDSSPLGILNALKDRLALTDAERQTTEMFEACSRYATTAAPAEPPSTPDTDTDTVYEESLWKGALQGTLVLAGLTALALTAHRLYRSLNDERSAQ